MVRAAKLVIGNIPRFSQLSAVLFLVAGVFWASTVMMQQGDLLLVWPSLASFASAGLIFMNRSVVVTRSVALATGLYNFIIFSYQTYSAFNLLGSSFASFASLAAVGYVVGAVIFLFLVLGIYGESEVFGPSSSRFSSPDQLV